MSVAGIALRVGVTQKRMRARVCEILARRGPAAPEEFAAEPASRLNEAQVLDCSAMLPGNLKAVGLMVRIVRDLGPYHRFVPADRRAAPAAAEAGAPADRPEKAPQVPERIEFAPGNGAAAPDACVGGAANAALAHQASPLWAPQESDPAPGAETAPQAAEIIDSARGKDRRPPKPRRHRPGARILQAATLRRAPCWIASAPRASQ